MRKLKVAVFLVVLCGCLAAPSQALAVPTPAWKLTAVTLPTNLAPGAKAGIAGPVFYPVATNVGSADSAGPVTITATLPVGFTPVSASDVASDPKYPKASCVIASQTVTCESNAVVGPGNWVGIKIGINVSPGATGVLISEANVAGGGAELAEATTETTISPLPAPFGYVYFDSPLTGDDGAAVTLAGSRPERLTVDLAFPVEKAGDTSLSSTEHPRKVEVDLPRGLIGNPDATPVRCTEAELTSAKCPRASQVGTVTIMTLTAGPNPVTSPIYNMIPPYGAPASLGFDAVGVGIFVHLIPSVRSDGDYGLTGTVNDILARPVSPILSAQTQLWGDPTSPIHDKNRECSTYGDCPLDPSERTDVAFLTMPTECSGASPLTKSRAYSWENPKVFTDAEYSMADLEGNPATVDGCNQLEFEPTIAAEPTTNLVDSPSGLRFKLHQPQDFSLTGRSTAALKDATVTLPEGMVANPSQAGGLAACSPTQIGLTSAIGATPIRFDTNSPNCPDAAKLGEVTVTTPLLDDPVPGPEGLGAVYLAEPFDNPFDSLLAIYIAIDDPGTDTVAKLAGEVRADPESGQLTTRFEENPQLPLEDIEIEFFEGARAPLRTPPACQTYAITTDFTPWSAPEGANANPTSSFAPSAMPGGGECPSSAEQAPNSPAFSAGTRSPQGGAFSPLLMKVSREDGSQELSAIETVLPPGLTGKLAGIATCSEAQIDAAKAREAPELGALELASPSCPAASQLGEVDVAAGSGPTPFHVQGRLYLAGPYKGAPLSFVIITPAIAGPFDLGAVVVRAAAYVDPKTGQPRAVSDPLPKTLEGIPTDVRVASVNLDRPGFVLNPTSCDPMAVQGSATSVFGQKAPLSSPFQAKGCASLGFKPRLALRLRGGTKRGAHPQLRAVLTPRRGDANIARASVALPRSAFLDQGHIRTVCTRVQFAAEQCPKGAIYGRVRAMTPLLDEPLEGPVYLRSSDNELPDTVAVLKGPASRPIQIEVAARIDSIRGGIRANFDLVPDAPVTKVVVTMLGNRKGLLINSRNLCRGTNRATVKMDGQNGKVHDFRPVVKPTGCRKGGKGGKKGKGSRRVAHRR